MCIRDRSIAETIPSIGYSPIMSGIVCAIMMVSAVLGVKYMGIVSWIAMPFFFVISIIATFLAVGNVGGWASLLEIQNDTMSFSSCLLYTSLLV